MRLISVWALRPGMVVARSVMQGSGAPLLRAGVKLRADYIQQLKKMDIRAIYIHDHLIPDVEIEDVILEETREKAITLVRSSLLELTGRDKQTSITRMIRIKEELSGLLDDMVAQLLENSKLTINLSDIRHTDDYTFSHSVNVAVLAMMTAISMGMGKSEVKKLGLGAFLHDLGKVLIPLAILNKPGRLGVEEYEEIRRHPAYGIKLVQARQVFNGATRSIVYKHHERVNGSGYPQGLKGDEMEIYPKICAVCDVYDALVSDRPYRPGYPPHRAMEMMEAECEGFDLHIMQVFYHHLAAYPVGTVVGLNDGTVGVVVHTSYGHPTRPRVRIISRKEDLALRPPYETDLLQTLNLVVDRVYSEQELPPSFFSGS